MDRAQTISVVRPHSGLVFIEFLFSLRILPLYVGYSYFVYFVTYALLISTGDAVRGSFLRTDQVSKDVRMFVLPRLVNNNTNSVPAGEQSDDNRIGNNAYVLSTIFHPPLNLEITNIQLKQSTTEVPPVRYSKIIALETCKGIF